MSARILLASFIALSAQVASAAPPVTSREASIPFANRDGIIDWKVVAPDKVYLLSAGGGWYFARTSLPCRRMATAMALGFDTAGSDRLDRFGAIVAEGRRCPIASLVRSAEPDGWRARKRGRRS